MDEQQLKRPSFRASGAASIKHLNVRKEGPDDEKILAVDIKMEIKGIHRFLCWYFDDALELFLWRGETNALIERNIWLTPVQYGNIVSGATAHIGGQTFVGAEIKKFIITPRDGGVINLTCSVTIHPNSEEVSQLAKLVQDQTYVSLEGPKDLFDSTNQTE